MEINHIKSEQLSNAPKAAHPALTVLSLAMSEDNADGFVFAAGWKAVWSTLYSGITVDTDNKTARSSSLREIWLTAPADADFDAALLAISKQYGKRIIYAQPNRVELTVKYQIKLPAPAPVLDAETIESIRGLAWRHTPTIDGKRSHVLAYAYDHEGQNLYITFRDGEGARTYAYKGVPREVYLALEDAPSKGKYVNRAVRSFYESCQVDLGEAV